jgi:hypothetical protein
MNNAEFTVIQDNHSYSIVWLIFNKDSEIGKRFNIQGDISLPHFIAGEDLERLRNNEEIGANEYSLAVGLLLEYFTPPPLTITHKLKPYFKEVLEWILKENAMEYRFDSTEQYILAVAAKLSSEFSAALGYKVLKSGLEIVPRSPAILKMMLEISNFLKDLEV